MFSLVTCVDELTLPQQLMQLRELIIVFRVIWKAPSPSPVHLSSGATVLSATGQKSDQILASLFLSCLHIFISSNHLLQVSRNSMSTSLLRPSLELDSVLKCHLTEQSSWDHHQLGPILLQLKVIQHPSLPPHIYFVGSQ